MDDYNIKQEKNQNINRENDLMNKRLPLSWTAYIWCVLGFMVFAIPSIIQIVALILYPEPGGWWGVMIWFFIVLLIILWFLSIKNTYLYIDKEGVWIYSGIFPWSKGGRGMKWRDLQQAGIKLGFFSWLFKSYTITLTHRYTLSEIFVIEHVANGDRVLSFINQYLDENYE